MKNNKNKNILLVEDEVIIAMSEKAALEKRGYAVITASNGEEAVELVKNTTAVDLILIDIDLGRGMDGTEAAGIILANRDIPVVFLSSHAEPEIVEKTERITSYGYVVKGSNVTVIDASIKMAFKLFDAKTNEMANERMLLEREKYWRTVLQATVDGFAVIDLPDIRFSEINEAYLRMSGYTREEFLLLHVRDIEDMFSPEEMREKIELIIKNGSGIFETRHRRKDGSIFDAELSATYLNTDGGKLICFVRDITARKQAEHLLQDKSEENEAHNREFAIINKELKKANEELTMAKERTETSEQNFKQIFDHTIDVIFLIEVTEDRRYKILLTNPHHQQVFADLGNIQNKFLEDFLPYELSNALSMTYDRCVREENIMKYDEMFEYNGQMLHAHTQLIPLKNSTGRVYQIIGVSHNITELKHAEEALRASEDRYRSLMANPTSPSIEEA